MNEKKNLCPNCSSAFFCKTWGEWECCAKKKRIYFIDWAYECADFKKRPAKWKEMRCGCGDCQKNELLMEENDEEG